MSYPQFYDNVETIKCKDPLAEVLGAYENGEYEITYAEVVRAAGHSCPTVAGAYLMTKQAIKSIYPDGVLQRGDLRVEFSEDLEDGVAGVIANVISQITGATQKSGFKGLGGRFARHSLMDFNAAINSSARFTSNGNGKSVDVVYDPSMIPANPNMMQMMQQNPKEFGAMWQDRVKRIFENTDKVITLK